MIDKETAVKNSFLTELGLHYYIHEDEQSIWVHCPVFGRASMVSSGLNDRPECDKCGTHLRSV